MPQVSAILPVFNAERYIGDAVQSILDQTFRDFELIIINDGSTDGSLAVLEKLAAKDSRIRLVSRPNTGYVKALNEAVGLSTGEFIARMDADDFCLPGRFEQQVSYLNKHPDCSLLGTNVNQMDQDGSIIGPMRDVGFGHDSITHSLLRRGWPIVHPSVMMRAAASRKIGGYVLAYCPNEDHDLFLKMGEVGRLENLPQVLLNYRKHTASESVVKQHRTDELVSTIIINACRRRGIAVPAAAVHPKPRTATQADTERDWGWHAIESRNIPTAKKYALITLRNRPMSVDAWKLAFCAARGR
jgi:glycosyltransferase involved in cell wall biosynthesis